MINYNCDILEIVYAANYIRVRASCFVT